MGFSELLQRGFRETTIHRRRESKLLTVGSTELPYVLLGSSVVNVGDTVVRQGTMKVEEPALYLFHRPMQFEGFDDPEWEGNGQVLVTLGRAASFPPGRYSNIETRLDVFEGPLEAAIEHYTQRLESEDDHQTALISGPVDIWPLSLVVYAGTMVMQSAVHDVHDLMIRRTLPRHWS